MAVSYKIQYHERGTGSGSVVNPPFKTELIQDVDDAITQGAENIVIYDTNMRRVVKHTLDEEGKLLFYLMGQAQGFERQIGDNVNETVYPPEPVDVPEVKVDFYTPHFWLGAKANEIIKEALRQDG